MTMLVLWLALIACQTRPTDVQASSAPQNEEAVERQTASSPVIQNSMQSLKHSLMTLRPYIFNKKIFSDAKHSQFLSENIHKMATESLNVKHDPVMLAKDPTVRFVATQFADELRRADENFKNGWTEYSRSQLIKVTGYCLECHTRLHQGPSFDVDETSEAYVKTLPVIDQIEFMISFRQFEAAYQLAIQKLSLSGKSDDISIQSERLARLALIVSVRYMKDPAKTKKVTQIIDNSSLYPSYLKESNQLWKKSLAQWKVNEDTHTLIQVRKLVNNRVSEIDDLRAISSLLYILVGDLNPDELGEALLLTGQSYESLNKISPLSLAENYYESCIRKATETKWAKVCYGRFSDLTILGYSGSSGTHVPKDIQMQLDELKKIIDKAHPKSI